MSRKLGEQQQREVAVTWSNECRAELQVEKMKKKNEHRERRKKQKELFKFASRIANTKIYIAEHQVQLNRSSRHRNSREESGMVLRLLVSRETEVGSEVKEKSRLGLQEC